MRILDVFTAFHNWLLDKDFLWWPFSFMKPAPGETMTFKLSLLMTACFGGLTFAAFTIFTVVNNVFTFTSFVMTLLSCSLGFLSWFNLITRPLWNRRTRRLQAPK